MANKEILKALEAQQMIQMRNHPKSEAWEDASGIIHELATMLNDGVPPQDACGR